MIFRGSGGNRGARRAAMAALVTAGGIALVVAACSSTQTNELMLALQTDLSLPKDVDQITIEVTQSGKVLFHKDYPVGPDGAKIPATLGVVDDPDQPGRAVRIRVIARQATVFRILRQVSTTIPTKRVATLRMPLQWLCWNHDALDENGDPKPSCPDGQSCVGGSCVDETVDSATLATFAPGDVFGGGTGTGDGACFDTVACFSHGQVVQVNTADCTIAKPPAGAGINVAMVRKPGVPGICSQDACFVPVDNDAELGWTDAPDNSRIELPPAVCERLARPASDKLSITGIAVTSACSTKTLSIPTCGPWSSVNPEAGSFEAAAPTPLDSGSADVTLQSDGAVCDPVVRWPAMLASPIVPPFKIAGLDFTSGLTIEQAEQINCGGTATTPLTADGNHSAAAWGASGDVFAEYDNTSRLIDLVVVQKAYAGTVTFNSRAGSDFGQHTYEIGIGKLTRDGTPITIDWANANGLVSELYDAYQATFAPAQPAVTDCVAAHACYANATVAGTTASGMAFQTGANLYLVFNANQSLPIELYTYTNISQSGGTGDAGATTTDAGAKPDAQTPPPVDSGATADAGP